MSSVDSITKSSRSFIDDHDRPQFSVGVIETTVDIDCVLP